MLITLDLRGSAVTDLARSTFGVAFRPIEDATRVVVRPIQNTWRSATNYGDLVEENKRLKDLVAYGEGATISAIASVREAQELLALNGLPTLAGISSCTAQVVGESPSNFAQTIELNRGSECGIRVGMPVLNAAGLIGKITKVYQKRAVVMLVSDPSFALAVKVVNAPPPTTTIPAQAGEPATTTTSTSTTTTVPRTTTTVGIPGFTPGSTVAPATGGNSGNQTGTGTPNKPGQAITSPITVPPGADLPLRETGALEGRGLGKAPIVRFIENLPRFGEVRVGSPIISAGGATSLAPPDIVIGTVQRVIPRGGTLGPLLEVKLTANLDSLNFVRILLYQPTSEKPQTP